MKRRQRGAPITDTISVSGGAELMLRRSAAAAKDSSEARRLMLRARASRDAKSSQAREAQAVAKTALRRAEAVVAEQAGRTAELRKALVQSRQHVMELEEQLNARATQAARGEVVAGLRERLTAGNGAYAELMEMHSKLRAAFDAQTAKSKMVTSYVKDWDMLCMKLYQSSRGQSIPASDRAVLQRWSSWRSITAKKASK